MFRLMWFFLGVLISIFPMLAFADTYQAVWGMTVAGTWNKDWAYSSYSSGSYHPSVKAACEVMNYQQIKYSPGASVIEFGTKYHNCVGSDGGTSNRIVRQGAYCLYGGTLQTTSSSAVCINAPPCPQGKYRDPVTGECIEPPCKVGDAATTRAWVGYAATRDNVYDWINPSVPSSTCDGQCSVSDLTITIGSCSVSPDRGGPPFPGSCEFTGKKTGGTCSTASGTSADAPPPIPCPSGSAMGEVNGVAGCYGKYEKNEVSSTTNNPDGSTTKITTKINPDGSTTKTTETTDSNGNKTIREEKITSTPSPGDGPLPGQGGGGSSGGSGSGGSGAGGSGTSDKGDTEQADFCRDNPSAAICKERLPIDETGTPSGVDALKGRTESMQATMDAASNTLQGSSWKQGSLPFVWNPQLPQGGSCGSWDFGKGLIDLCPAMDRVRSIWSWVIYMVGLASIWAVGVRAVSGGGK